MTEALNPKSLNHILCSDLENTIITNKKIYITSPQNIIKEAYEMASMFHREIQIQITKPAIIEGTRFQQYNTYISKLL